jgi:hypothetical protein
VDRFGEHELSALDERVVRDVLWLELEGIDVREWGVVSSENRLVMAVAATDPEAARRMLHAHYGERVRVDVVATLPYRIETVPWERCEIAADDRTLTIWWSSDAVRHLFTIEFLERPHEMVVAVREAVPRGTGTPEVAQRSRQVVLAEPLAGRPVVDAATRGA